MSEGSSLRVGFGVSGPLGQAWFPEARTRALIEAALADGVVHFDTAPFYFDAERRLGATLQALGRSDVFVSTKTGTRRNGRRLQKDFSEAGIRADVEESLRRLGRDRLDLLYLHGPDIGQTESAAPVMTALKQEGKIRRIGVCGEGEPLRRAVTAGFDAIMGAYNLIDRRHEETFAMAKARGVLAVAIAPLAQGVFDRRYFLPSDLADIWRMARTTLRGRYADEAIRRVRETLGGADPVEAAVGFVLANPAVDMVMTTTTKPAHLAQTLAAARLAPDSALLDRLSRFALDPPQGGA